MSILAAPRTKQRISIDPQNLGWKEDDQKLSRKLMEKMGWSDGDGLGRNRQGDANNVKLKANYSGKGLGADKLTSYDSTWIGHHDDFADLLSALNKNKEQPTENGEERAQQITKELNKNSIRRRISCQKFMRAKDTSLYSTNDKSSVMGVGLKRANEEPKEAAPAVKKEEPSSDDESVPKPNTVVSSLSVNEYFAAKMAALKAKRDAVGEVKAEVKEEQSAVEVKQECEDVDDEAERKRLKRERKAARRLARKLAVESETVVLKSEPVAAEEEEEVKEAAVVADEDEERAQRKRDKKRRREERARAEAEAEMKEEVEEPSSKRVKEESVEEEDCQPEKQKKNKKSKKVKEEQEDEE